jgi:hypothetical protein
MRTEGSVPSGKDRPSSRPAGRIVGPKRALKEKQIWAIRFYCQSALNWDPRSARKRGSDAISMAVIGLLL